MDLFSLRTPLVEMSLAVFLGLGLMVVGLIILGKLMPFSMKEAISKKRNDAVSVILFSVLLGLGIIISTVFSKGHEDTSDTGSPAHSASKITSAQ